MMRLIVKHSDPATLDKVLAAVAKKHPEHLTDLIARVVDIRREIAGREPS